MTEPRTVRRVSHFTVLEIAVASYSDPRTVKKVLDGRPVKGGVAERIESELARRHLLPEQEPAR